MSCLTPIQAVRSELPNENGKFPMLFDSKSLQKVHLYDLTWLPCGRCIACRLKKSSDWAFRMMCEAKLYGNRNSFITLTFSPDNLPSDCSLDLETFQDFLQRLRDRLAYAFGVRIRFFHCGEYGDLHKRPHYHSVIFGWNFPDKYFWKMSDSGHPIYRSPLLEKCWPFGHSSVGEVTFESAAYVARYVTKRADGDLAIERYSRVDPNTGELRIVLPEYATMSRMPGIGKEWFMNNYRDIYPKDFMTFGDGRKMMPPPYFDKLFKEIDPHGYDEVKERRVERAHLREGFSFQMAESKRKYFEQSMKLLVRNLE